MREKANTKAKEDEFASAWERYVDRTAQLVVTHPLFDHGSLFLFPRECGSSFDERGSLDTFRLASIKRASSLGFRSFNSSLPAASPLFKSLRATHNPPCLGLVYHHTTTQVHTSFSGRPVL